MGRTIREGSRYTILEIDATTARDCGALMRAWADRRDTMINR